MAGEAVGFWSYAHTDNDASVGLVRELAAQLSGQYQAITGEPISLFVDRLGVRWGDEWRERINEAIIGTTFFIPILTPSYFKSQECRRELLKFLTEATRLGLRQLLLPVYWIEVPQLEVDPENSTDEAIRLVSPYHREDLRNIWLEDPTSSTFRKAVNRLALQLAARVKAVEEESNQAVDDARERDPSQAHAGDEDDDAPGSFDVMEASEHASQELTKILNGMAEEIVMVGAIMEAGTARLDAAKARSKPLAAARMVVEKIARELSRPADEIEALGHRFAAAMTQLDPGMLATLDQAAAEPNDPDRETFLDTIDALAANARPALDSLREMVRSAEEVAALARALRRPLRKMRTGLQGVIDGQAIIDEWKRRADEIRSGD